MSYQFKIDFDHLFESLETPLSSLSTLKVQYFLEWL